MMVLDQYRTFLAVYRAGSITGAARSLGRSQPTVTAQIRSLEAALGRPLFDRQPRGVTPTPAAAALAHRLAGPLDELEAVLAGDPGAGDPVFLGGPTEVMSSHVAASLVPLIERGHQIRLTFGLADDLLDDLVAGHLDLAVSTVRPRRRGVRVDALADEEFVMVAAPRLAESLPHQPGGPPREATADLATLPWVAYADDLPIIRRFWRTAFGSRPPMPAALVIPDLRGILAAVLAGAGASVLPSYLCADDLSSGRLVQLARPDLPPINTVYLAARADALRRPAVAELRAHLLTLARTRTWS